MDGIDTLVCVDFFDCKIERQPEGGFIIKHADFECRCAKILYTGKIDEYFGYCHGALQYRSVRFEHELLDTANYQGNAVINYTEAEVPYTRVIEHKHFEAFGQQVYDNPKTVVSREYPMETAEGQEPYYPVNNDKNNALYQKYRAMADAERDVIFGGRLAEYKYYDMAPIVEKVMNLWGE